MRHLCNVGHQVATLYIFSNPDSQRVACALRVLASQNIAQSHSLTICVWYLNTDCTRTGNWREDSHFIRGDRIGNVVGKPSNGFYLHARSQLHLIASDCRTTLEARNLCLHIKLLEDSINSSRHLIIYRAGSFGW